jgi:dipeptidyl aminopeptidase/acylaminoacyl peptidase
VKRRLERVPLPDEHGAEDRAWQTVRAAYEEREPVRWPRRHARSLALAAAAVAIVAAAVTPPGKSVVNSVRDVVGRSKVVGVRNAHRELVRLPAAGRLLVNSARGPWVVQENGSRRPLGRYRMATWSPHGKFVAAVRNGYELVALEPNGKVHWVKPRKQGVASPRWSYEGYRIAYLSGTSLRVITGDGATDWGLGQADAHVAPAWRPATHEVALVTLDGSVRVMDADKRTVLWTKHAGVDGVRALTWSGDGALLLVRGNNSVRTFTARGGLLGASATKGPSVAAAFAPHSHRFALVVGPTVVIVNGDTLRFANRPLFTATRRLAGIAWAPDGSWLLVSWPSADQFVFVRIGAPKLTAVSNITLQFGPGARVEGWCCTS